MADLGFDGKVAIITGAGGGLGRSHALDLAKRGALIVVNDLGGSTDGTGHSETAAQKVVDEIKAAGGEAVANYDSVATPEGGQSIVQTAVDSFGRIDIIINNAGILRDTSFKNMTPDQLNPVLDVHLRGAFYVTQPAWQIMRDQGYGRIINTSSAAGIFGNFGQGNYGAAKKVVDEIKAAGGEAVANYDSVATPEGGQSIVQTAVDSFGRIDIIINNAGILRDTSFKNMTPDQLNPVLDVHLRGAFYVTQPAWQIMRDQGYGRIINTSSAAGIFGNFGQGNYGAAKMGLVGLTRVLAIEGAKNNIKVNAIAPVAKTRMTEELLGAAADKLAPEFVTPVVTYLAHEDCPVTGEVYSVGGGRVARIFIGVTPGYYDAELTAESVRDHFDDIRKEDGYEVPANLNEEMMLAFKASS